MHTLYTLCRRYAQIIFIYVPRVGTPPPFPCSLESFRKVGSFILNFITTCNSHGNMLQLTAATIQRTTMELFQHLDI